MEHRERMALASLAIVGIFLTIQVGSLAFVEPAQQQGLQETEDGGSASLSIAFVLAMLVATALMLAAIKYGGASLLRGFIILATVYISFFVFEVFLPELGVTVGGAQLPVVALAGALAVGTGVLLYPEWYVIDTAGVVMGIGAAGLFGVNFGIFPAIVLLSVLAVYDAVSVYGTEHMLTLASGVMEMRVPVVLVVPLSLSYSFLDADPPDPLEDDTDDEAGPDESDGDAGDEREDSDAERDAPGDRVEDGGETTAGEGASGREQPPTAAELEALGPDGIETLDPDRLAGLDRELLESLDDDLAEAVEAALPRRDAMFIGLGDAIIPTVLVTSAAVFLDSDPLVTVGEVVVTLPALTAILGTIAGLVVLLWMVAKGRAHAGLPLLNGGSIAGYLLGALASGLTLAEALGVSGLV